MTQTRRTDAEVLKQGMAALHDALGVLDADRFVQLFSPPGTGNYTAERHARLGHLTLEELLAQGDELRASGELPMPPEPESRPASA